MKLFDTINFTINNQRCCVHIYKGKKYRWILYKSEYGVLTERYKSSTLQFSDYECLKDCTQLVFNSF